MLFMCIEKNDNQNRNVLQERCVHDIAHIIHTLFLSMDLMAPDGMSDVMTLPIQLELSVTNCH